MFYITDVKKWAEASRDTRCKTQETRHQESHESQVTRVKSKTKGTDTKSVVEGRRLWSVVDGPLSIFISHILFC
jgi:hypothetical protein